MNLPYVQHSAGQIQSDYLINNDSVHNFSFLWRMCRLASNDAEQILFYLSQLSDNKQQSERLNV